MKMNILINSHAQSNKWCDVCSFLSLNKKYLYKENKFFYPHLQLGVCGFKHDNNISITALTLMTVFHFIYLKYAVSSVA